MEGADLTWASFKSTWLTSSTSDFSGASFADFTGATGMTQGMVDAMFGNAGTILPEGLERPAHWPTEDRDILESRARYCAWLKENDRTSPFCSN